MTEWEMEEEYEKGEKKKGEGWRKRSLLQFND